MAVIDFASELLIALQSRTMRWLLLFAVVTILAAEIAILTTGTWLNIGSAPPGTGCRYWTGTRLVYRQGFDPLNCPLTLLPGRGGQV